MKLMIWFGFFLFGAVKLTAADPVPYLKSGDVITVSVDSAKGIFLEHKMAKKQTLFSLSKFYGLKVYDIYHHNPMLKDRVIAIGDRIIVPLAKSAIFYDPEVADENEWVKVLYKVRKKDNLFRLSRVYFDTSIDALRTLNDLAGNDLKLGQVLQIGWINLKGIDVQDHRGKIAPVEQELRQMESDFHSNLAPVLSIVDSTFSQTPDNKTDHNTDQLKQTELEITIPPVNPPAKTEVTESTASTNEASGKEEISKEPDKNSTKISDDPDYMEELKKKQKLVYKTEKGAAMWTDELSHVKDLYALHREAAVGSVVEITNPFLGKKVFARVIAALPANTYGDEVRIIVSPGVANLLGAVDPKFYVKVRYLAPEQK